MCQGSEPEQVRIEIKRKPGCEDLALPSYMSAGASGMDLCAAVEVETIIQPAEVKLVPTGFHIAVPQGYEAQIRPRSGLALRHGVTVLNSPGTVDSDYRAEVGVVLANLGKEPVVIKRGMRIAQMVICPTCRAELAEVDQLSRTERQHGGFGSTGVD